MGPPAHRACSPSNVAIVEEDGGLAPGLEVCLWHLTRLRTRCPRGSSLHTCICGVRPSLGYSWPLRSWVSFLQGEVPLPSFARCGAFKSLLF